MTIFSIKHLILIFILILFPILISTKIKKSKITLSLILLFLLSLEIFKFIFLILTNNYQLNKDLPLQLCYLYPLIGLIYLMTKKEFLLNYLGAFGILFAIAAIFFTNPKKFSFDTIYCYFYHFFLLISGVYITKNYKTNFYFKNIIVMFLQIIPTYIVNSLIKNGSNYIFLNTFLDPFHYTKYVDNVSAFNIKLFGISINDILIFLINTLGKTIYILLFILLIISFSSLFLYIFSDKHKPKI